MKKLNKIIKLTFDLKLLTGLHIGSSNDNVKIGGIDSPVIKNPLNNEPYIPGSSLKGKMRYLLGINKGVNDLEDEEICNIFGKSADNKTDIKPTKIIIRDLSMTDEWKKKMEEFEHYGIGFTEEKAENTIDRGECKRESKPRFVERVPAGVEFSGEIVLKIFENDSEEEMKKTIEKSLEYIENDALGGSGSRGYGQIQITNKEWE